MRVAVRLSILVTVVSIGTPALAQVELPGSEISRIAFGSCAKHWQPQPIWDAVIGQAPDLWLFLGDNIYGDTDGKTAWLVSKGQLAGEWNRLADKPEFQRARSRIPMMATWDNHDYGSHAGGVKARVNRSTPVRFKLIHPGASGKLASPERVGT